MWGTVIRGRLANETHRNPTLKHEHLNWVDSQRMGGGFVTRAARSRI